jgi:hypothetical protein
MRRTRPGLALLVAMVALIGTVASAPFHTLRAATASTDSPRSLAPPADAPAAALAPAVHVPLVTSPDPTLGPGSQWPSPFGVQTFSSLASGVTLSRTVELNGAWVRLADRVSWRALQPNEGDPIQWELLADFELELRALQQIGITPVVIINYFPRWATVRPTSCGAIRADKFATFAQVVAALVTRYQAAEFNVHYWELGNEPDVDPSLVGPDNAWGCWGDAKDPFYGGRQYGRMLKVVTPAVKAADPQAQVWIGGLLLARPDTSGAKTGRPELFLQGILEAGAAPDFDVLPYHIYADYSGSQVDYDITDAWVWKSWGGRMLGKARFLKQLMAAYGVDKPIVANEIGLLTCPANSGCSAPGAAFQEAQANFVVRSLVRGIAGGVQGFVWYELEWPGFRYSALLDQAGNPKPVYYAYQQLALQLKQATYLQPVNYGAGMEAYAFRRGAEQVHIIWTVEDTTIPIVIPRDRFIRAIDREGQAVMPSIDGANVQLSASFAPIYLFCRP